MPTRKSLVAQSAGPGAPAPVAQVAAPKAATKPVPKKAGKSSKSQHNKPVRDSFTMPETDFALIAVLKARTISAGRETKKSELLRAGLHALAALPSRSLVTALDRLERVKVGRPKAAR